MSNIDNLDLPVPKYCSLHQAVHWLSTGERIISEKDFFRISEDYKKNINYLKIEVKIENRDQFIEEIKKII